jgi:excisionase family DNA binding protein
MNHELNDIVLLRTAEAARLLHISVKTVNRWTDKGILPCKVRTLGGHRRYDEEEVRKLQWLLRQGKGRPKRGRPRRDRSAAQPSGLNGIQGMPAAVAAASGVMAGNSSTHYGGPAVNPGGTGYPPIPPLVARNGVRPGAAAGGALGRQRAGANATYSRQGGR